MGLMDRLESEALEFAEQLRDLQLEEQRHKVRAAKAEAEYAELVLRVATHQASQMVQGDWIAKA